MLIKNTYNSVFKLGLVLALRDEKTKYNNIGLRKAENCFFLVKIQSVREQNFFSIALTFLAFILV